MKLKAFTRNWSVCRDVRWIILQSDKSVLKNAGLLMYGQMRLPFCPLTMGMATQPELKY